MINTVTDLETGFKAQLSKLSTDIRNTDASLISTKEGYLKVQGALEILDILKKTVEEEAAASLAPATD
jgi:hypothetical protein